MSCRKIKNESQEGLDPAVVPCRFFLITALFVYIFLVPVAGATVPPAERAALVDLYDGTNGPYWKTSLNWKTGDPCDDSWYGITCNGENTHVTWIILDHNFLHGPIPSSFGDLSQLQYLDLRYNELSGSLLPLTGLTQLQYIYLSNNMLAGAIPPFTALTQLSRLELRSNLLSGPIPTFAGLDQLQVLRLNNNNLSGAIPPELSNLNNLQHLYLNYNGLEGTIPPELALLGQLTTLYLFGNNLSGPIPPEFGSLSQLKWLDLQENQLEGTIPPELGNLSKLVDLRLGNNKLQEAIPAELANLSQLQILYLDNNELCGPIPTRLASLEKLLDGFGLNIGNNHLSRKVDPVLDSFINAKSSLFGPWKTSQGNKCAEFPWHMFLPAITGMNKK